MNEISLERIRDSFSDKPLDQLEKAIVTYDRELANKSVESIVKNKVNPMEAFDAASKVMGLIGEEYSEGELFLPDLLSAADIMMSVLPILEKEIKKGGEVKKNLGKIVLGTVLGDIHSIGKTMVGTLLIAGGFEVYDLGINISSDKFINAVKKFKPNILAMSALLTTTAYEQKKVIDVLKEKNLRNNIKIMIGGGAVTREYADSIGADGYDSTAPGAVVLARKLMAKL